MPKLPEVVQSKKSNLTWRSAEAAKDIAEILSGMSGGARGWSYFRTAAATWLRSDEKARAAFTNWYEKQ